jgi:hypothetical protein
MPFETFFGDELFFAEPLGVDSQHRADVPISPADVTTRSKTSAFRAISTLAFIQAVAGKGVAWHPRAQQRVLPDRRVVCSACSPSFGGVAALGGLSILLFTPSLFMWSISALKSMSHTLAAAIEFACAAGGARAAAARQGVVVLA